MSNLLMLSGKDVVPNGLLLQIEPFNSLWERSDDKEKVLKDFAYIYCKADWKSEYNSYGLQKDIHIAIDIFGDKDYHPDKLIEECIEKYKELQKTPSLSLIDTSLMAVNSVKYFFEEMTIKVDDSDDEKKKKFAKFDFTKVLKSIKDIGIAIDALNSLSEKIMQEEKVLNIVIRGGGNIGVFENDAPWIK